jgi:hypothetical protein
MHHQVHTRRARTQLLPVHHAHAGHMKTGGGGGCRCVRPLGSTAGVWRHRSSEAQLPRLLANTTTHTHTHKQANTTHARTHACTPYTFSSPRLHTVVADHTHAHREHTTSHRKRITGTNTQRGAQHAHARVCVNIVQGTAMMNDGPPSACCPQKPQHKNLLSQDRAAGRRRGNPNAGCCTSTRARGCAHVCGAWLGAAGEGRSRPARAHRGARQPPCCFRPLRSSSRAAGQLAT